MLDVEHTEPAAIQVEEVSSLDNNGVVTSEDEESYLGAL